MKNIIISNDNLKKINIEYFERKKKLIKLKKNGFNFPNHLYFIESFKKKYKKYFKKTKKELKNLNISVNISGRILIRRLFGKALFFIIQDFNFEIQIYISSNIFSISEYQEKILNLEIGDIIGIQGILFKTNTQELSIYCQKIDLLNKSLYTLPKKFYGLRNQELKYRRRYLDLIINQKTKKIFITRSKILSEIRFFMEKKKFIEVETPMMHIIPGGALAKPFITYNNTLHQNMYLRIAPEIYLKQIIIGGFKKIFEINRNFRNEGISTRHNPEFTMMECYTAYNNYKDMMLLLNKLLLYLIKKLFNSSILKYKKNSFDFKKKIPTMTMYEAILFFNPNIKKKDLKNLKNIKKLIKKLNLIIEKKWKLGHIINYIFEKTTEKKIISPTFITHYPIEVSPLSKADNKNPNYAERFEFFLFGYEIANGYSELNDSEEQKKRFKLQLSYENKKKNINNNYDKDYIHALEYGLPPTAGLGVGIDRLIMILTNNENIRDVIFFPTLRIKEA
ncbi:lysine--tRNA ligase [Buchnera aphidicola]|uniref:lysine--tRNA ligase n=1 Tax=Buchnera aphidicola TaxID=9 RepID=UPI0031B705E5